MEDSVIYDLLAPAKLDAYREELENEKGNFVKWTNEDREALEKTLNDEQLNLLEKYMVSLARREEYVDFQVGVRTLNFGIKIGVQLQKSIKDLCDDFDEENDYE